MTNSSSTKLYFNAYQGQNLLKFAGVVHLLLGAIITFSPELFLGLFKIDLGAGTTFFHLYGMLLGVLGVGHGIASQDSFKNWQFAFISFLFHLMGAYIFFKAVLTGELPLAFSATFLIFSLLWPIAFYYFLVSAFNALTMEESQARSFNEYVDYVKTSQNVTLAELSKDRGVLLIFTRQFGCTFCREMLSDLKKIDELAKKKNLHLVFVHMSDTEYANEFFAKYYSSPIHHISDPGRKLYKSLDLKRGSFSQVFGLKVFLSGIYLALVKNSLPGETEGDGLQLGGLFVLKNKAIVFEDKAKSADYKFNLDTLPEY